MAPITALTRSDRVFTIQHQQFASTELDKAPNRYDEDERIGMNFAGCCSLTGVTIAGVSFCAAMLISGTYLWGLAASITCLFIGCCIRNSIEDARSERANAKADRKFQAKFKKDKAEFEAKMAKIERQGRERQERLQKQQRKAREERERRFEEQRQATEARLKTFELERAQRREEYQRRIDEINASFERDRERRRLDFELAMQQIAAPVELDIPEIQADLVPFALPEPVVADPVAEVQAQAEPEQVAQNRIAPPGGIVVDEA